MTLIQTVFGKDRIIQVSDRRLTNGANGQLVDDFYTKLVLWNDRYTVGFTGIARVDRRHKESTAQWIAETLADYVHFEHGAEALRAEAGKRVKKLPRNWDRRLAIVIAGFDQFHDGPVGACITNMDMQTNRSADPTVFKNWRLETPNESAVVHSIGAALSKEQDLVLTRYVRRELKKGDGLNDAVRLMVRNQRDVAKKNKTVGPDALVVHIPRAQSLTPGGGTVAVSNLGSADLSLATTSFGYFDRNGWQWKQEAPLIAGGGFVKKFWASADPDHPDNQRINMQLLSWPPGYGEGPPPQSEAGPPA